MREGGSAFDIAKRVDIFCGGFELVIDVNEVVVVCSDSCGSEIKRVGVWNAAGSDEEMCAFEAAHFTGDSDFHMNARTVTRHFFRASFKKKVNAVFLENFGYGASDVGIFVGK